MHRTAVLVVAAVLLTAIPASADFFDNDAFQRTWARTDQPVQSCGVNRTWMWGPEPRTSTILEPYAESPDEFRQVVYFDKSRMEITDPHGDQTSEWYVSNGLLARDLITGKQQVGNNQYVARAPAELTIAGDPNSGPTYAALAPLLASAPAADGAALTQRLSDDGQVTNDPSLSSEGVTAAQRVDIPGINHQVASVFWAFMNNSSGTVWDGAACVQGTLSTSAYYITGLPITEAYWVDVELGGNPSLVLLQCFERRCLTYAPGNDEGWKVEAGNVGQHYYSWLYHDAEPMATGNHVIIGTAYWGASGSTSGQYVTVRSHQHYPLQLEGWTISDEDGYTYTFPEYVLYPGYRVIVYNCTGTDGGSIFYTGVCEEWWDPADTATLRDSAGNLAVVRDFALGSPQGPR